MADPIHQFELKPILRLGHIGSTEIVFTNASLFMFGALGVIALLTLAATRGRALVPGRLQSIAEMSYEFVAATLREVPPARRACGSSRSCSRCSCSSSSSTCSGMIPCFFTVTSHIIVTFALAALVIGTVLVYGFAKHGLRFLRLFVPSGVPVCILPLVVLIEVISFLSRPISLSVRLFANMLAGHITLKVFAGFVASLGALGAVGWLGAVLPLGMTVALTALEFLVALLQAYVFAMLTCIYLNDALHPGH